MAEPSNFTRIRASLNDLLSETTRAEIAGRVANGWALDNDRVVVWEQRNAFGRRGFDWDDVPSTLIDEDASSGGRTVLLRPALEDFLDRDLRSARPWRWPWG